MLSQYKSARILIAQTTSDSRLNVKYLAHQFLTQRPELLFVLLAFSPRLRDITDMAILKKSTRFILNSQWISTGIITDKNVPKILGSKQAVKVVEQPCSLVFRGSSSVISLFGAMFARSRATAQDSSSIWPERLDSMTTNLVSG